MEDPGSSDRINPREQIIPSPTIQGAQRALSVDALEKWIQDRDRKFPVTIFVPGANPIQINNNNEFAGHIDSCQGAIAQQGYVDAKERMP